MLAKRIFTFCLVAFAAEGCQHATSAPNPEVPPPTSNEITGGTQPATVPGEDQFKQGNAMIAEGKKLRDEAMKMSSGEMMNGLSKNELMIKADKLIATGTAMKQRSRQE